MDSTERSASNGKVAALETGVDAAAPAAPTRKPAAPRPGAEGAQPPMTNSNGKCWTADYSTPPRVNGGGRFIDKGD